jgi:hypothetical protein
LLPVKGAAEEPEEPNNGEKVLFKVGCRRHGEDIPEKIKKRRDRPRRRESANLRPRAKHRDNRRGKKGSPPPSLKILAEGVLNIAESFRKLALLADIRIERVRIDTDGRAEPGDPWD